MSTGDGSTAAGRGRRRRAVLPEDAHARALAAVVRAQYFPDLPALEATAALVARRAAGDGPAAVAAVRRAARALQEHRAAEAEQEAAQEADTDAAGLRRAPRPLHLETLTGFHERVVSEDNAEFSWAQEEERKEREEQIKGYLLLTNETSDRATTSQQRHHPLVDSPLPLASDLYDPPPSLPAPWSKKVPIENSLFFVPSSREQPPATDEAATKLLMPPPSSRTTSAKQSLVEYTPKTQLEKKIEPAATRFTSQPLVVVHRPHWEGSSDDDDGTNDGSSTDASTDLDAPARRPLAVELQRAKRRRQQELQTYVPMTPLVAPTASPITTWGRVGATPLALSLQDRADAADSDVAAGAVSYALPAPGSREAAADKALAALEERRRRASGAAQVRSSAKSPATVRRASSVSARSSASFGTALRASYARSASASHRADSTRQRDHAYQATPQLRQTRGAPSGTKNLTDDLLHL